MFSECLGVTASLIFKSLRSGLDKAIILSVLWWLFQTVKYQEKKKLMLLMQDEAGLGLLNFLHVLIQPLGPGICLWEASSFFLRC